MRNIYVMIVVTILFFIMSMDFLFTTNVYIDLLLVILYLGLVARAALNLKTDITVIEGEYILKEKNTAYFAPLIFIMFLSFSIGVGIIMIVINVLVVVLLYVYVFISIKENKIIISHETITAKYLNGNSASMKWSNIVRVDFSWIYNLIIFTDKEDNEIKLDISLKDFLLVINMMKEKLLKEDYEEAFKKLRIYNWVFLMNSNNMYLK